MGVILKILPVFIGWLIWRKTGNIIVGAVAAFLLEPVLGVLFGQILSELALLFVRTPELKPCEELPPDAEGRGVRYLI